MVSTAVVLVAFGIYRHFVPVKSWLALIISAIICGVIGYLINYCIVLTSKERQMVKDKVLSKINKK